MILIETDIHINSVIHNAVISINHQIKFPNNGMYIKKLIANSS